MLNREQIENSPIYQDDISDIKNLASCYFDWIATLIAQAQTSGDKTFLDIAQYLADSKACEFLQ